MNQNAKSLFHVLHSVAFCTFVSTNCMERRIISTEEVMQAVKSGHVTFVRELVEKGACLNVTDREIRENPLHIAARQLDYPMMKYLTEEVYSWNKPNIWENNCSQQCPLGVLLDTLQSRETTVELETNEANCLLVLVKRMSASDGWTTNQLLLRSPTYTQLLSENLKSKLDAIIKESPYPNSTTPDYCMHQ